MYLGIKEVIIGTSVGRVIVNSVKYFFTKNEPIIWCTSVWTSFFDGYQLFKKSSYKSWFFCLRILIIGILIILIIFEDMFKIKIV